MPFEFIKMLVKTIGFFYQKILRGHLGLHKLSNILKHYEIFGVCVIDEKPGNISIDVSAQLRLPNVGFFMIHIIVTKNHFLLPSEKVFCDCKG